MCILERKLTTGNCFEILRLSFNLCYCRSRRNTLCRDFKFRQKMPTELSKKIKSQEWDSIVTVTGLPEGKGVFAKNEIRKNTVVCNYGGSFRSESYANKWLLPFDDKCFYLLELHEKYKEKWHHFYLNHDEASKESFGKYLNHSRLHPNLKDKLLVTQSNELDVIFYAIRNIKVNEQLVWDYGKEFTGIKECISGCKRCHLQTVKKKD